jgi:uncharacterized membrane protein YdbT with pleckstrin-like domain
MDLVEGERILWQGRPSWRSQISFFVVWIPLALLPAIIAGAVKANDGDTGLPYWQWILISLVLVVLVIAYDVLRRLATFYAVTTQRLRIRRGLLARTEQTARFDRVQNVNITQSLMDRLLHVGAVDFDTAGSGESEADFRFRGISNPQRLVHVVAEHSHPHPDAHTAGL